MRLSVLLQMTFLSNSDGPLWNILCIIITENILLGEKCAATVHGIYFLRLKGGPLIPSDANLALGAPSHCNSSQPAFCLSQHISCKWIFKDLHIYITEFLSLKFRESAKFCPQYVNFPLVSHSGEHSDGEHVCCRLRSQTLKPFSFCFSWITNKCTFLWRVSPHKYM